MKNKISDMEFGELYQEYMKVIKELEKYKNIEEELGIDLITLVKALKNGAWCKFDNVFDFSQDIDIGKMFVNFYDFKNNYFDHLVFNLKDYGVTWGLTKEELE